MKQNGKSRDELAREANRARSKLLHTVEQLDQRRHEVLDIRMQIQQHVRQLVVAGGILLVATGASVALIVYRVSHAAQRRRRGRWTLAKDVWRHPDRALRGERRSFFGQVVRSVLMSLVTAALTIPARRFVAQLVERNVKTTPAR